MTKKNNESDNSKESNNSNESNNNKNVDPKRKNNNGMHMIQKFPKRLGFRKKVDITI